jgi:hypothetical protein
MFSKIYAVFVLFALAPLAAVAASAPNADATCPNTDALSAQEEAAYQVYKANPVRGTVSLYLAAQINTGTGYISCSTKWIGLDQVKVGYAEYQAATKFFIVAQMEQTLGFPYKDDLEQAWQVMTSAVQDLPSSKLRDDAAQELRDIEHYQTTMAGS